MSFGFSVGDFMAGAKLIADLTRVLSASKGASMEYQELILDLQLVETTLVQIHQMFLASQLNTSATNALACIVQSTKAAVAEFMARTKKYRESLSTRGSGNKVKDVWLKIGWSLYKPAEIRSLQQRLQLDLGSINILISLAVCDKSSLRSYYDEVDAGSYAQSRKAYLLSYGDDDFGVIVHRRITQEFVIGRKMASFDPIYRQPSDPSSFFRVGQAFAVLLPEQRVYKNFHDDARSSKKTLYLSYQLPELEQVRGDQKLTGASLRLDERLSDLLSEDNNINDKIGDMEGPQITYESRIRNSYIGEAGIRRLIVVREGITSALCLPIQTYSGRGCIDQFGKQFFGIVYSGKEAPKAMDGEEGMTKIPIHLNPTHPADTLHTSSRIHYSKLYRVDHNLRVKGIGLVDVNSIHALVQYFEESSIKLTADLKFDAKSPRLVNDGDKSPEPSADSPESNRPSRAVHEIDKDTLVSEQPAGRYSPTEVNNMVESEDDKQCEDLFGFEL